MNVRICIRLALLGSTVLATTSCDFLQAVRERMEKTHEKVEQTRAMLARKEVKPDEVVVKVLSVGPSEGLGTAAYVGSVEASRAATVTSPASGSLTRLAVHEGQKVTRGQLVARVESQTLKSSLRMAQATYDQARDAMERLDKVYASGSVPEVKMVEMKTNLNKAQATLEAARRAVEDCNVKSPVTGVVERVDVIAGEEVTISQPLLRVVDVNTVEVHFPLPENEFNKVPVGSVASVEVPALGKNISARVANRAVVASQLSHSYDCTLGDLSDLDGLMPGMVCKISIASEKEASIVVPSTAVMTDGEGRYVWTVEDGVVGKAHITVGGYEGSGIVVSDGLHAGMKVIVEGARKVSTGMMVKTVE